MLPKQERLRKTGEFQKVFRHGQAYADALLVLHVLRQSDGQNRRAGFSVSKKVGKAVIRNLVKRRIREAYRAFLPEIGKGFDVVWVARASVARADYAQIAASVEKLLRRGGLLSPAALPVPVAGD